MARRETVCVRLPPLDRLPPACDRARVVLQQHHTQHLHSGQLPQPARRVGAVHRLQQAEPVAAVGHRELGPLGLRSRQPPTRAAYRLPQPSVSKVLASQSGAATANASRHARTDSPANSNRFRSRTAASTWVESVRCLPPAASSPLSVHAASSTSRTRSARSWAATRARNSLSTVWSNPSLSSSMPRAYFQSMPNRTRCSAPRSVRFSASCSTVTSASRPGDQPSRPRVPNASANSSSANSSPSSSRTRIASGTGPRRAAALAARAVASGISGHGSGRIDMTPPSPSTSSVRDRQPSQITRFQPQPVQIPQNHPLHLRPELTTRVAFGLKPWLTEEFKVSTDPFLLDKVRDVVGLYLAPPANAAVFSVDEKPQIQALERTAPVLPMMPGVPERRSHDYQRHGTLDLFAALNIATGKVIATTSAQHRAEDFKAFLDDIDRQVCPEPGGPCDLRQPLGPQGSGDPPVAAGPPAVCAALHPDVLLVAQPGGAVVC